jgi:hypothetical protein
MCAALPVTALIIGLAWQKPTASNHCPLLAGGPFGDFLPYKNSTLPRNLNVPDSDAESGQGYFSSRLTGGQPAMIF